ncbi:MAG: hypothetical protein QGF77_05975 [Candidatus Thalassarchaeaceae archaeon]|nr:hypothetical protein [Candidatus Thalassarchaeaceae archaeon]
MVEDKCEERQWEPSDEFLNSEMLDGWYFQATKTDKPTFFHGENDKGTIQGSQKIYFFTNAKALSASQKYDSLPLQMWLGEIDDTARFEINASTFELIVTKGNISEELRIFIQEDLSTPDN